MQLPVRVRFSHPKPYEENTHTRDVSAGGVYLYTNVHPGDGKAIEFILVLPPQNLLAPPIEVRYEAEVVRVEPLSAHEFGVAARTDLKEFVAA